MTATEQLDLFSVSALPAERLPPGRTTGPLIACNTLDDDSLVAAILDAGIRDSVALVAEAGCRGLAAAIPVLEALCRRFTGFGADWIVPEQAAALGALVAIGGADAAQTIVRLIAKRVVQGPCLRQAVTAAARLGAKFSVGTVLELVRHDDPQIRESVCRCARPRPDVVPPLRDLLDDLDADVRKAAACDLREEPTAELLDAIAPVADDECVILLGRVARAAPDLSEAVLDALDAIDHPWAEKIVNAIREKSPT